MKKQKEKHILTNQQGFTLAGGCCNYRNSCRNFCSGLCSTAGKKQGSNRYGQCPGCLCRSTNCRKFR